MEAKIDENGLSVQYGNRQYLTLDKSRKMGYHLYSTKQYRKDFYEPQF